MGEHLRYENLDSKNKVRVLHVFAPIYKSRFGGPIYYWQYCFSKWNNPDIEHYVLDTQTHRVFKSRETFDSIQPDIPIMASRRERALWIFSLFMNLMKHKNEYDIIHLHVLWWGSLLTGLWAKWENIPVIYESVLLDADTPGGILKTKLGAVKVWFMKFYTAILAISENLAEDYRKFGFSKEQVFLLMNCVDMELFSPVKSPEEKTLLRKKLNFPQNKTILLFVGSIIERKGVDILIRAFIEADFKCSDLYLLMVGPKNKKENPSLDEDFVNGLYLMISKHNLSESVYFLGLIPDRKRLAEIYRSADFFVFPSRREGLPNVLLESMATALPVVVTQLPVLEKVIKHGENGLIMPIGDVDALKESILLLSNDPELSRKIGHNARSYVEEHHGFQVWQARLVEFYKSLMPQQKTSRLRK